MSHSEEGQGGGSPEKAGLRPRGRGLVLPPPTCAGSAAVSPGPEGIGFPSKRLRNVGC